MHKKDYDGMRYPSVDDLLKVIDSKYKLAYVAARRAHIIEEEEWTAAEDESSLANSRALNAIFNVVDKNVFRIVK